MIYLIYGTDVYLKDLELKKILKGVDSDSIFKFDLNINNLNDIIDDFNLSSLFTKSKYTIVNNSYIFSGTKCLIEHDLELLEKYLENINPDTNVIFILDSEKLDTRKKIVKKAKDIAKIIDVNKPENIEKYVRSMLSDFEIAPPVLNLFIERSGNNLQIISNEIEKIKICKEDEIITEDDILDITSIIYKPDVFVFVEAILNKNHARAFELYSQLILMNEEPIKLIIMLANQFRLIYQSKLLFQNGFDQAAIAKKLDIHPYRVKLALEKGRLHSDEKLLSYIKDLADLDYKIKYGETDKNLAFEIFILSI